MMDRNELIGLDRRAHRICNNEQNISYRGQFQYQVMIRHRGFPTVCRTFDNVDDAIEFRDRTKATMKRGTFVDTSELNKNTLSDLLDRYAREITPLKKSADRDLSRINVIKRHPLANELIGCIGGKHIASYRDFRLRSVGTKTAREELILLHHLFRIAIQEWGLPMPTNPADHVRKPPANRPRDRRLAGDEEERLLAACMEYGGTIHDVVIIALETAMRRGEIASLRWADIKDTVAHLEDTKNGERRDVPLSSIARAAIARQVRQLHDDRVFGLETDSVGLAFRRACKRAGIEGLRFHDLRHEAISRLFEKGMNPMQVSAISGHKTLQMLKRYTHLRAEDLAKMLG